MSIEGWTYRLQARGRPVGRLVITTGERGRVAVTIATMQLQGALGSHHLRQTSRAHASHHHSLAWREESEDPGATSFEVRFDQETGLMRATRGRQDTAQAPLLVPYRDPLSLLRELRALTAAAVAGRDTPPLPYRIPLLGKDVVVVRADTVDLPALGERWPARTFTLYPGGSSVSVSLAPPHPIVRLVQRLDEGPLEATLIDVREEATLPGLDDGEGDTRAQDAKRRARRRRPRKRGG